jgi:large subunit ribosomal protein L15e
MVSNMGAAKYIKQAFQNEWKGVSDTNYDYALIMRKRGIEYRNEERAIVKIDHPTNLPSARSIGYKAKQGIFVVRVRVRKGTGTHHRPKNKRRPKRQGQAKLSRKISTQAMSEQKASKYFENAEVLGSYKIAEDGKWHYFEVVMADRTASTVLNDKNLAYLADGHKGRAERGKTFAGGANKEFNKINMRKHRVKKALDRHFG